MRAINLAILHILIFGFFQLGSGGEQIKEPSFVASNQFDEPLVSKIKCHNRSATDQEFAALIRRPTFYTTSPVIDNDLENRFSLFSNSFKHSSYHCRFEFDASTGHFQMRLTNFEKCGVIEMRSNDNKPYLSVNVRFAQLAGLRTKNDLNLVVICREQSRVYSRNHKLDFRPGDHLAGSNTRIFANDPQQFHVKLQLFAADHNALADDDDDDDGQAASTAADREMDDTIEVGEMIRLNAVVRSGDGWNYAFLKDVLVSRRPGGNKRKTSGTSDRGFIAKEFGHESPAEKEPDDDKQVVHQEAGGNHRYSNDADEPAYGETKLNELVSGSKAGDQVLLVDENGCRNPTFQPLAPSHPYQANDNGLDVNFEFRAFVFESMDAKLDRLRISAKIVACQQLEDCKPVNCEDAKKRKRRWTKGHSIESTDSENTNRSNSDIIANSIGINGDINSLRISSANGRTTANGSKLRRTTSVQPANGRSGRLIRQFERQLEFRVRPRAPNSDYVQSPVDEPDDSTSIHVFSLTAIALLLMSIILGFVCLAGSLMANRFK